ncbi:MAG: hypothetical protein QOE30_5034 [Mycobacterium sp.]|uniref:DUF6907 domain-containing protein n=1 Tax=Mycobacterium sp. TaxID=1785 RepID=UPI0028B63940|nr:hypothetical protein [Mycobacterium sp.]MDT5119295.1 hypothetical protein [Mycobacterium sp.]
MPTTTATNPCPSVPLPPGAEGDIWQDGSPMPRRDVYTVRCVLNSSGDPVQSPLVMAQAVQWADGTIASPSVVVECAAPGLTSDQARELASVLLDAAAELDGWAR